MYLDCNGTNLYYETIGTGQPLLAIHGFGIDMNVMKGCLEPIFKEQENIQRLYIDLPGMGKTSEGPNVESADDILEILLEFVEKVIGASPFYLVGESYGGYLMRGLISKIGAARIEKAAFICPVIFPEQEKRELPAKHAIIADSDFLTSLPVKERELFEEEAVILTERTYNRWVRDVKTGLDSSRPQLIHTLSENYSFGSWFKEPLYAGSALWLLGRQDHVVGYRDAFELDSSYQNATMLVVNGAGHNLQYEQEAIFNFHLRSWLDEGRHHLRH